MGWVLIDKGYKGAKQEAKGWDGWQERVSFACLDVA